MRRARQVGCRQWGTGKREFRRQRGPYRLCESKCVSQSEARDGAGHAECGPDGGVLISL